MSPKRTKILALAAVLAFALLLVAAGSQSLSAGVTRQTGLKPEGCVCHGVNKQTDGKPNGSVEVLFVMTPHDMVFKPGGEYNLTVGAGKSDVPAKEGEFNKGGFNLKVSGGTLTVPKDWEDFVQVSGGTEATHTAKGDQRGRTFNLTWKAPTTASAPAVFTLFVNTVNGDGTNTELDHFNGGTFVVLHQAGAAIGAGAGFENPEHIGVNWLAHWVGIVSFLAVMGTLLIYYFVLKYGESIHTTDHRDRKEK